MFLKLRIKKILIVRQRKIERKNTIAERLQFDWVDLNMNNSNMDITNRKREYSRALLHANWAKKRARILKRDGYSCKCCGREENLQVHHRQYHKDAVTGAWQKPWAYDDQYLVTLCEPCHNKDHKTYNIPVFGIWVCLVVFGSSHRSRHLMLQ